MDGEKTTHRDRQTVCQSRDNGCAGQRQQDLYIYEQTKTLRQIEREAKRQRETKAETETDRQTNTYRQRDRETDRGNLKQ